MSSSFDFFRPGGQSPGFYTCCNWPRSAIYIHTYVYLPVTCSERQVPLRPLRLTILRSFYWLPTHTDSSTFSVFQIFPSINSHVNSHPRHPPHYTFQSKPLIRINNEHEGTNKKKNPRDKEPEFSAHRSRKNPIEPKFKDAAVRFRRVSRETKLWKPEEGHGECGARIRVYIHARAAAERMHSACVPFARNWKRLEKWRARASSFLPSRGSGCFS